MILSSADKECMNCENIGICKWCDEMSKVSKYIKNTPRTIASPIKVEVKCDKFKKKEQKLDGWYGTNQRGF